VIISEWNSSFYRISATLNTPIDPAKLQEALDHCIVRFPYYRVRLRQGAFWLFLEENDRRPEVEIDRYYPCLAIKTPKQKDFLFRILYLENKISLEMSHVLTDGFGSLVFLKNIIAEYLRLSGHRIPFSEAHDILDLAEPPRPEESIDAFHRIYDPQAPKEKQLPIAYQMHERRSLPGVNHVITGRIRIEDMLKITRPLHVSITEYLTAVLLYVLQDIQRNDPKAKRRRPIRLNVPTNLRKFYNIKTMKNFSLYTTPEIDTNLGDFSFEETLHSVHHYMRKNNTEKYIKQQITRNVGGEINPFIRGIPFPIKKVFLKSMHAKFGETQQTVCLSNLGNITVPEEMLQLVKRIDFVPAGSFNTKTMLTVTGYNGYLYLTFGRITERPLLERHVFTFLRDQGLSILLESNNPITPPGSKERKRKAVMRSCRNCRMYTADDELYCPLCGSETIHEENSEKHLRTAYAQHPHIIKLRLKSPIVHDKHVFYILTALFLATLLTTIGINIYYSGVISWSLYSTASIILVWALLVFPYYFDKFQAPGYLLTGSISISLFLLFIDSTDGILSWFWIPASVLIIPAVISWLYFITKRT
jgi:hypothetical protein